MTIREARKFGCGCVNDRFHPACAYALPGVRIAPRPASPVLRTGRGTVPFSVDFERLHAHARHRAVAIACNAYAHSGKVHSAKHCNP